MEVLRGRIAVAGLMGSAIDGNEVLPVLILEFQSPGHHLAMRLDNLQTTAIPSVLEHEWPEFVSKVQKSFARNRATRLGLTEKSSGGREDRFLPVEFFVREPLGYQFRLGGLDSRQKFINGLRLGSKRSLLLRDWKEQ